MDIAHFIISSCIFVLSFEATLATSTISKVKKFFIIALLILKPLFHVYEFTESMEALIEYPKTERTNTVKLKKKKEAIMKTQNVKSNTQARDKKPSTKHAGSPYI